MNRAEVIEQLKSLRGKGVDLGIALTAKTDVLSKRLKELSNRNNFLKKPVGDQHPRVMRSADIKNYTHTDLLTIILYKVHPSILFRMSLLSKQVSSISLKEQYWEERIKKEHLIREKPKEVDWRGWYMRLNRIPIAGRVEAWGNNNRRELGFPSRKYNIDADEKQSVILKKVNKDYSSKIIDIHIHMHTTYFLTDNGSVWMTSNSKTPYVVPILNKIKVKMMGSIQYYIIILTYDNVMYIVSPDMNHIEKIPGRYSMIISSDKIYTLNLEGGMLKWKFNYETGHRSVPVSFDIKFVPTIEFLFRNKNIVIHSYYIHDLAPYQSYKNLLYTHHFERII